MQKEIRANPAAQLRGTAAANGADGKKLAGYAALFNVLSDIGQGYLEYVRPFAFGITSTSDVRALVGHSDLLCIGRQSAGTLAVAEDKTGLKFTVSLPSTYFADALYESVKRKDITGCSYGFICTDDRWMDARDCPLATPEQVAQGWVVREIIAAEVFEISPCAFPAFTTTTCAVD